MLIAKLTEIESKVAVTQLKVPFVSPKNKKTRQFIFHHIVENQDTLLNA